VKNRLKRRKIRLNAHIFILLSALILITSLFVPAMAAQPDIQVSGGGRATNDLFIGGTATFGFAVNGIATSIIREYDGRSGHVQLILMGDEGLMMSVRSTTIEHISIEPLASYDRIDISCKGIITIGDLTFPDVDFSFHVWNDAGVDWIRLVHPISLYYVEGNLEGGHIHVTIA
jgi:hypothetical protein